ncbi:MAG: S4 domain-containing protein, partial [Anaerococcus sp.]|nr:S4 domain-containing protein [Anaerococcus sp.]
MRINKFIAKTGLASRRKSEEYIKKGLVFVNGKKLEDLSYQVKDDDEVK